MNNRREHVLREYNGARLPVGKAARALGQTRKETALFTSYWGLSKKPQISLDTNWGGCGADGWKALLPPNLSKHRGKLPAAVRVSQDPAIREHWELMPAKSAIPHACDCPLPGLFQASGPLQSGLLCLEDTHQATLNPRCV